MDVQYIYLKIKIKHTIRKHMLKMKALITELLHLEPNA